MKVSNPESLITVLVDAAVHTRNVMTRRHIVQEDSIRAGQFMTSLRSQMDDYRGNDQKDLSSWLTDKGRWADILVLKTTNHRRISYGFQYSIDELQHIVEIARTRIKEISPDILEVELNELDRRLDSSKTFITRAKQVNKEAEGVMGEFEDLANKIEEDLVA